MNSRKKKKTGKYRNTELNFAVASEVLTGEISSEDGVRDRVLSSEGHSFLISLSRKGKLSSS